MRAVVTVVGKDRKGIIAKVSAYLLEKGANVEDISQTVMGEYFAMIMIVDLTETTQKLADLALECKEYGTQIGMSISMQHEDVFNAMHNV